jgi:hypothetical protein
LKPDPHGAGCTNQLRLVLQEVTATGGVSAFDSALHLFYSLTRNELVDLSQSIARLRRAAAGNDQHLGPLSPHPLIKTQGVAGTMATGVRALILQYAGQDNLTRVTEMSSNNAGFNWAFQGFDVSNAAAAAIKPMVIPTLASSATQQTFFRGFANAYIQGQFLPATTSADNITVLADHAASAASVQPALAAIVKIDNPTKHSPDTIDCASCHLASPLAALVAVPNFSFDEAKDPNAYAASGGSVSASEMTSTFDHTALLNLHAFSYIGKNPSINQRTVNETAAIVEYLNHL